MAALTDGEKAKMESLLKILQIFERGMSTEQLRDAAANLADRCRDCANELISDMVKAVDMAVLAHGTGWRPLEDPEYQTGLTSLVRDAKSALAAE